MRNDKDDAMRFYFVTAPAFFILCLALFAMIGFYYQGLRELDIYWEGIIAFFGFALVAGMLIKKMGES